MIQRQLILVVFTLFFYTLMAGAEEVNRIGIIDFQRILETSEGGKKAQAEIKSQGEKMEASLKEKGGEIEELRKRLEREALVMDKGMREEKEREYRIKVGDFRALEDKYKAEFKELNARLVSRLQKEVFRLVENVGKKDGYLLILEKREAGVIYAPSTIDITDQLIPLVTADKISLE